MLHPRADRAAVKRISDAYRYGPAWYLLALGLAFVSVTASLILNLALALFFAAPGRAKESAREGL